MAKKSKIPAGIYSILGAGIGLFIGLMCHHLALDLIFGFAIGIIIDSIVYSNNKRT